jgi:membrane protein implicated in regulation of membrane protease activity|tara:strand:- start:482 stop:928 length:447 start_codon:yes stop_codon:yes gene_type:complete
MDIQMLYWHWLVLGILLIIGEIFIPSFTILWFGLGALVVAVAALLVDMPFSMQVLLWTLSSVAFTVLWFKAVKPRMTSSNITAEAHDSAIGESGQVIKEPTDTTHGKLRFTTPVLDRDEWEFTCDSEVALGDRLYIKEISGDLLLVQK